MFCLALTVTYFNLLFLLWGPGATDGHYLKMQKKKKKRGGEDVNTFKITKYLQGTHRHFFCYFTFLSFSFIIFLKPLQTRTLILSFRACSVFISSLVWFFFCSPNVSQPSHLTSIPLRLLHPHPPVSDPDVISHISPSSCLPAGICCSTWSYYHFKEGQWTPARRCPSLKWHVYVESGFSSRAWLLRRCSRKSDITHYNSPLWCRQCSRSLDQDQ